MTRISNTSAAVRFENHRRPGVSILHGLQRALPWDVAVAASMMALVSFSLPGREGPESAGGLDPLALAKIAIRIAVAAWFGSILLFSVQPLIGRMMSIQHTKRVFHWLLPWWIFLVWCFCSIAWSPLKIVSLGQWLGLAALVSFAHVVALRYRIVGSEPDVWELRPQNQWTNLVLLLNWILLVYSLLVAGVHVFSPEASGLNRSISLDGSNGFVHPTAVGATSSLGILLVTIIFLAKLSRFTLPVCGAIVVHTTLLYLSESRSALLMTAVGFFLCILFFMRVVWRGWSILSFGIAMLLWMTIDPGFDPRNSGMEELTSYLQRGQSAEQLRQVSGRSEMWQAIIQQIEKSPLLGHGYFVTSPNGKLDVWYVPANHDSHYVLLQVLVSTGSIGLLLFMWALLNSSCYMVLTWMRLRRHDSLRTSENHFVSLVLIFSVWFAGWGQGCVTFLGPIRPESVVFFGLLGLLASHAGFATATKRRMVKS